MRAAALAAGEAPPDSAGLDAAGWDAAPPDDAGLGVAPPVHAPTIIATPARVLTIRNFAFMVLCVLLLRGSLAGRAGPLPPSEGDSSVRSRRRPTVGSATRQADFGLPAATSRLLAGAGPVDDRTTNRVSSRW